MANEWATNVRNFLRPIGYENYWMSNPGIDKPESEDEGQGDVKQNLAIIRNYMHIRLQRLQEILRMLGG